MFKRIEGQTRPGEALVTIHFEETEISARPGDTVASALLAAGITHFRTSAISGARRGPHCLMGVCFECLVEIDGIANQQACLRVVEDGMRVSRQDGAVALDTQPTGPKDIGK